MMTVYMCIISECTRSKYMDPDIKQVSIAAGPRTHAQERQDSGIQHKHYNSFFLFSITQN